MTLTYAVEYLLFRRGALRRVSSPLINGNFDAAGPLPKVIRQEKDEMAVQLERIGHCALRVRDLERSKKFYTEVLRFQVMEEDPDHGGVFMSLPGDGHTIDVFPVDASAAASKSEGRGSAGLVHIAFKVATYDALNEAYDFLQA